MSDSDEQNNLIVEVELAPGAIDQTLVLPCYGVVEARPIFNPEQGETDEARISALREEMLAARVSSEGVSRIEQLPPLSSFVRLKFPGGTSASQVIKSLKQRPEVTRAVVVPQARPPEVPDDSLIGTTGSSISVTSTGVERQWYLHRTRVPPVWQHATGKGVVIAAIDWGFFISHQDLRAGIERTYNAVDGTTDVTHGPRVAHGTAVLGIAGARPGNGGLAGYAPEATLWAIQGDSGTSPQIFEEPWAEAIDYARRTDAGGKRKVIMVQIQTPAQGNYEQVPSVHRAIRAAIADGCVVCVAAGNGNKPADRNDNGEPFDPTGSILVGATTFHASENRRARFSNFGDTIVVSAPGDLDHDVTCGTSSDHSYRNRFGGTSGAASKVAGTIALMLSVNPNLTHDGVRDILGTTGSAITEDPGKPIGVFLNTEAAVAQARRRRNPRMS
ncbi:MAG TPA: S8 family serine peptidase [Pyrinomonadaceae bacterium]